MTPASKPEGVWSAVCHGFAHFAAHVDAAVVEDRKHGLLFLSGGPTADFNVALLQASPDEADLLREFATRVRQEGTEALFMWPTALGARLAHAARAEGLTEAGTAPLMLLEIAAPAPRPIAPTRHFSVERVQAAEQLAVVADLIAEAFGLDRGWVGRTFAAPSLLGAASVEFWLASSNGEPCSTVMSLDPGSGPVGIWNMATRPSRQHQGAGRAVLDAALREHCLAGNNRFYLIATVAGKPLYDALGFETLEAVSIFIAGHSEQFAG